MRIHSLTLDNVRGIDHLELKELPDTGVIVIHGDNEKGKSTILDALHLVLNEKHSAKNKVVKAAKPVDRDVSPSVAVTMSLGPVAFSVEKTWFRDKSARLSLSSPQRQVFTGDEAESKLKELIAEHLDSDLLSTLFLRQDDLGNSVDALGISSLTRALDGASGTQGAGIEDTGLMAAVNSEYQRYYTATGKQRGELAQAMDDVKAATEENSAAQASAAELDGYVLRHDHVTDTRARATAVLPEAVAEAEAAAEVARVAAEAAAKAEALAGEVERAEREFQRATHAVEQRRLLIDAVVLAAAELDRRRAGLEDAAAAAATEAAQLVELGEKLEEAKRQQAVAAANVREARSVARRVEAAVRRDEVAAKHRQVTELTTQIAELRQEHARLKVSDAHVRAVEEASQELILQQRLREQTTSKLQLTATTPGSVLVNGEEVAIGTEAVSVELERGSEITIGEVTARYLPGLAESAAEEDLVARATARVAELLQDLGCSSLDALRTRRDAYREVAEKLAALERERTSVLSGTDAESLAAELAGLTADGEGSEALPEDLDVAAATANVRATEEELDRLGAEAAELDAALTPWRERQATTALSTLSVRIEAAEQADGAAKKSLADAEEKAGAAELDGDVDKQRAARDAVVEQWRVAQAEVAAADPERAAGLHRTKATRVESLHKQIADSTTQLAELSGRIEMATGAAERLEKAEASLAAATHRLDSVQRRAEAVEMLRNTLHRHRDAARARYAQPFADELSRLARWVFGDDVEFQLSDTLQVTDRTVGEATVGLDFLSGGAREQLAILTRFAIAELVSREASDGWVPVPVVVDDALGSTDMHRLALMSTLFEQMGKKGQVIVLTCVPERYHFVQDRTEFAIDDLKMR
ncbi:chromosome segregation protein [Corynebacterium atrinae]|uniref:AAA family ATPase n=1 Tax=Corynebacterium atrinae TaxID=1336740 RepID=UPI0025B4D7CD|nr:AAA family ATPase [Corynebacterium atrinae]WJY63099.1 chromosome segregation protein [Corynebacterium atrinae]